MALSLHKDLKLYHSITEVAQMFEVSETLLRYWEREFPQIAPRKAGRNIRQYSSDDIKQIRIVYHLLKEKGLKIAAAREYLKRNKSATDKTIEVIDRLTAIKTDLEALRQAIE